MKVRHPDTSFHPLLSTRIPAKLVFQTLGTKTEDFHRPLEEEKVLHNLLACSYGLQAVYALSKVQD